jgi:hypothetical protein
MNPSRLASRRVKVREAGPRDRHVFLIPEDRQPWAVTEDVERARAAVELRC